MGKALSTVSIYTDATRARMRRLNIVELPVDFHPQIAATTAIDRVKDNACTQLLQFVS